MVTKTVTVSVSTTGFIVLVKEGGEYKEKEFTYYGKYNKTELNEIMQTEHKENFVKILSVKHDRKHAEISEAILTDEARIID